MFFQTSIFYPAFVSIKRITGILLLVLTFFGGVYPQQQFAVSPDEKILSVEDSPEIDVVSFGKKVIVKNHAKSVLAFGGDIIIEGRVDEEVVAIGGSIVQNQQAFVGGDIYVFGGKYQPESKAPLRGEEKQTVVLGVFEDELRDLMQNPLQIFSPSFTRAFLAQRILSVLFWFIISVGLTTLAPGAITRSVARLHLSPLKIFAIGFSAFILSTLTIITSLKLLPSFLSATFGLMAFILLMLAYVFGRVALQVSVGKMLHKKIFGERNQSESLAILFGVLVWTIFLSVPYVWTLALLILFAGGIGLVLTARTNSRWRKP